MSILRKLGASSVLSKFLPISLRNLSISSTPVSTTLNSAFLSNPQLNQTNAVNSIVFSASTSIIKDVGIRNPFWHKEICDIPLTNKVIENPNQNQNKIIEEISNIDNKIDLPSVIDSSNDDVGKQAARLIVIRRRKMKKHKLKKLRKKMKFEWAKVRQRRELRKEKKFQARLLYQIREAEKFSAEEYVANKIKQATENEIPRFWRGRRLPQFIIKEKIEELELKKRNRFN
ncbi:unnamed protein product [Diamesa tonsa]